MIIRGSTLFTNSALCQYNSISIPILLMTKRMHQLKAYLVWWIDDCTFYSHCIVLYSVDPVYSNVHVLLLSARPEFKNTPTKCTATHTSSIIDDYNKIIRY